MGDGFSIGQKPGGGDKPIPVGDIKTGLASEREGKQVGRPSEVTAPCLVSRDWAPSNGDPPLRVLSLLSSSLQLCSQTSGPGMVAAHSSLWEWADGEV